MIIQLELNDGIVDVALNRIECGEVFYTDPDFNPRGQTIEYKEKIVRPQAYTIDVRPRDNGNVPHFHVYSKNMEVHTCLCIDEAKYFDHSKKYKAILDRKILEAVDELLNKDCSEVGFSGTNWRRVQKAWNENPERAICSKATEKPDYTNVTSWREG